MTIHLVVLIAVCSLASASAAVTLAYARIFAPLREFFARWEWPSELFACPFCIALWTSTAAVLTARPDAPKAAWPVMVLAVHGGASLLLRPVKAAALGHVTPITVEEEKPPVINYGQLAGAISDVALPTDVELDGRKIGAAMATSPRDPVCICGHRRSLHTGGECSGTQVHWRGAPTHPCSPHEFKERSYGI